jgi:hypothetical protein
MKTMSAKNKGLITGAVMIVWSFIIYRLKNDFDNGLQYIVYATYVAGILWTLLTFKKASENSITFKMYFSEGFKCFIVVTFLMVLFTLIFVLLHPELKEQLVALMKADSVNKKDMAPIDIENAIISAKKAFLPKLLMGAVFGYLAIGALITIITAAILSQKK